MKAGTVLESADCEVVLRSPEMPSPRNSVLERRPTGAAIFPRENLLMYRRWAKRSYNLPRFASMEEPERMIEDIRAFFRPRRS